MAATNINIHDAKTNLSRYVSMAVAGEKIIICRNNIPVAQLLPVSQEIPKKPVVLGAYKGLATLEPGAFRATDMGTSFESRLAHLKGLVE